MKTIAMIAAAAAIMLNSGAQAQDQVPCYVHPATGVCEPAAFNVRPAPIKPSAQASAQTIINSRYGTSVISSTYTISRRK